jgi:hypothetical protein
MGIVRKSGYTSSNDKVNEQCIEMDEEWRCRGLTWSTIQELSGKAEETKYLSKGCWSVGHKSPIAVF